MLILIIFSNACLFLNKDHLFNQLLKSLRGNANKDRKSLLVIFKKA